ncbi:RCC1 and BTB domain-containing protein 1 [Sarcoptes scabiei]|uniref:RCC1 and BTB domain-containing protein 1 n=1 Tax=Sarcoptes scabiei TaxID=52283 RepID=A0A132A933_SARSC|nr:RCC1 and BTB domain-containing protein 1 [Sarcoptes scabiei]KPM07369.1 RCC1 domain containing protein [Sarcoptes scabiei]UXI14250.1 RCC1 and BTB domain-containing protein 1-like [Sarcoptes scabiei]
MTLERRKLRRSLPILNDLDSYLYADIKRVFVFGRESDCVFFITKNDHVFAYGKNNSGCLGVGCDEYVSEPKPVPTLNKRKIIEFAAGRDHILALTKNGQVFACGSNEFGQLALKKIPKTNLPQQILSLRKERIVAINCGAFHSLALTSRGLILGWGYNFWGQLGLGSNENQFEPVLNVALNRENIVEIACGQHHSVALSKKGDIFTWGHNAFGQLGIGDRCNYRNIPTKIIDGRDFPIKQVTCGQNHVLAVSEDGKLLGFGSNYYGQLGTGCRRNEYAPVKIEIESRIKDALSSPFSNTSLARTENKRNSLVFGKCGDHWVLTPLDTEIQDEDRTKKNHFANRPLFKDNKTNCHEVFVNLNQSTAHTTKVVKNKPNLFWQVLMLIRSKMNKINNHNRRQRRQNYDLD